MDCRKRQQGYPHRRSPVRRYASLCPLFRSLRNAVHHVRRRGSLPAWHSRFKAKIEKVKWLKQGEQSLLLTTSPAAGHKEVEEFACYPDAETSYRLLCGNWLFGFKNWDFSILLGAIYWIVGSLLVLLPRWEARVIALVVLGLGFVGYALYQDKNRIRVWVSAGLHTLAQTFAIAVLAWFWSSVNSTILPVGAEWWIWAVTLLVELGVSGWLVGGFLYGAYLYLSCRYWNLNNNDAFSALRTRRISGLPTDTH